MGTTRTLRHWGGQLLGTGASALAGYLLVIRPWHRSWGATRAEVRRRMPGDGLVAHPSFTATRAVTIRARPGDVWPWLAQVGTDRGGLYTYDWLMRRLGIDVRSAQHILPAAQHLARGDAIALGERARLTVLEVQAPRILVISLGPPGEATLALELGPSGPEHARLVSRLRWQVPRSLRGLLYLSVLDPASFLPHRAFLLGVKRRAERAARARRLEQLWAPARRVEASGIHEAASPRPEHPGP